MNFGIAVNDRRKNPQTGEWEDYANFVDCVLFGKRADWLSRDLHKGKKVFLEGKLRYSKWERDGQKRSKIEVIVDDIDYERPPRDPKAVSATQNSGSANYASGYQSAPQTPPPAPTAAYPEQPELPPYDADIPFGG